MGPITIQSCPNCKRPQRVPAASSAAHVKCGSCGHAWTPPGPGERWLTSRATAAGILLIAGFVIPLLIPKRGNDLVPVWLPEGDGKMGLILPLLLGIAALIVNGTVQGMARAITLFAMALGVLVLHLALPGAARLHEQVGLFGSRRDDLAVGLFVLLGAGVVAVLAGNHLRKAHPHALAARLLTGLGGVALALPLVLPWSNRRGSTPLGLLFEEDAWEHAWPAMLWLLGLVAYAVYALLGFGHGAPPERPHVTRATSVLARVLAFSLPALLVAVVLIASEGRVRDGVLAPVLTAVAKTFALLYGQLILAAAGLAAWLTEALSRPAPALASAQGPPPLPSPPDDLEAKLLRLARLRDQGLLTEEEFQAKRRQLIDTTAI